MNTEPVKTVPQTHQPQKNRLKKVLVNLGIGLGCVVFFVGAFLIATSLLTPSRSTPVQDGKAIIQKVASSDVGCEITVRLDGEDIMISDKDPQVCEGFEEGMDITEQMLSSN